MPSSSRLPARDRRPSAAPAWALAVAASLTALATPLGPLCAGTAFAQTGDELGAARQLFTEALKDEEQKRYASALEKYKRVQQVRDTVPVRYRIGSALEGLGRPVQAIAAYQSAVQLGQSTGSDPDVVQGARARIDALETKVAHLAIALPPSAPADAEVRVDEEPVARDGLADVRVNPGVHAVTASSSKTRPFRANITLPEGGRAEMPVVLESAQEPPKPREAQTGGSTQKTIGFVTAIAGGALLAGGAVSLLVRNRDIDELKQSCPGGACPASRQDELQGAHDRAETLGPVGVTLAAVGTVALGVGVALLVTAPREPAKTTTLLAPAVAPAGGGVTMITSF